MSHVVIRTAKVQDAKALLKMQETLDYETLFMMFEPGERSKNLNAVEMLIQQINKISDLLLVAEVEKEIVGFMMARRGVYKRIQHRAYLVVGVLKAFQGQGIGKRFFEELDHWAINHQLKRLELTVMKSNHKARYLYELNGFVIEGIKKDSMYVCNQYVDEYYMAKRFS